MQEGTGPALKAPLRRSGVLVLLALGVTACSLPAPFGPAATGSSPPASCPLPADAGFFAPAKHLGSYTYPGYPTALAVDPDAHVLLLADGSTRKLLRYDNHAEPPSLAGKSLALTGAFGLALDTRVHRAYVSTLDGLVAVDVAGDDLRQVGPTLALRNVAGIAVDPTTRRVYAPEYAEGRVHVYDWTADGLAETGTPVDVGRKPQQVAVDADRGRAYVANVADNTVSVLDITGDARVIGTLAVGRAPYGLAVDPTSHRVFVANQADGTVSTIEGCRDAPAVVGTPVTTHVAAAGATARLALDPVSHRLFVLNQGDNRMVVLDVAGEQPEVIGGGVAVRDGAQGLAVDAGSGMVYVGTLDRVEVIDGRGNTPTPPSASPAPTRSPTRSPTPSPTRSPARSP